MITTFLIVAGVLLALILLMGAMFVFSPKEIQPPVIQHYPLPPSPQMKKVRAKASITQPPPVPGKGSGVTYTCGSGGCQIDYFDDGKHTGTSHSVLTKEEIRQARRDLFGDDV